MPGRRPGLRSLRQRLQRARRPDEPEGCDVCGEPAKDQFTTFFLEEQHRFCSTNCKDRFEQVPPRYVA